MTNTTRTSSRCQRALNYAIIDEVDNILIDEARTPLIIAGSAFGDPKLLRQGQRVRRQADASWKARPRTSSRRSATASTSPIIRSIADEEQPEEAAVRTSR